LASLVGFLTGLALSRPPALYLVPLIKKPPSNRTAERHC
jgi:hypothetical protein